MKRKSYPYIFALLAVFIVSTMGISVYSNYCTMEGDTITLLSKNQDCCSSLITVTTSDCCHPFSAINHQNDVSQLNDNCCSHKVDIYKYYGDVINQDIRIIVATLPFKDSSYDWPLYNSVHEKIILPHKSPPYLKTLARLAQKQSYIL